MLLLELIFLEFSTRLQQLRTTIDIVVAKATFDFAGAIYCSKFGTHYATVTEAFASPIS